MKTLSYLLVVCFFFAACNNDQPEIPEETCPYLERIQPLLDCMKMPRPDDSYCYPCYPIDPYCYPCQPHYEINECLGSTLEEMSVALNIPTPILEKMSTQAVIQALWEYPAFYRVADEFTYQHSFDLIISNNEAYLELIKRPDAGEALLKRLSLQNMLQTRGNYALKEPWSFEILISQPVFLSLFNEDEKKKIIDITIKNTDLMNDAWGGDYHYFWFPNYLLIGRTMLSAGYAPFLEAVDNDEELMCFLDGLCAGNNKDNPYWIYFKPYAYLITPLYIPPTIIDFAMDFLNSK